MKLEVPNILMPRGLVKKPKIKRIIGEGIDNQGRLRLYQEVMDGIVLITDKRFVALFELLDKLNLEPETITHIYDLVLKEVSFDDSND